MGRTLGIKCPRCGKKFEWSTGSGFLEVAPLHCDKCGKEKEWNKYDMVTDGDLDCPCGGTFTDDAPIRCPKCKTEIADVSDCTQEVLMWE